MIRMVLITAILLGVGAFGYICGSQARRYSDPFKTDKPLVIEQMMSIQQQVGCKLIDGEIGPETKRLVNAKTKEEEPELFNKYAAVYIEAPEKIEEKE